MKTYRQLQRQKKEFSRRLLWTAALLGSAVVSLLLATALEHENGYGFWQLTLVLVPLGLASAASMIVVWLDLRKIQRKLLTTTSPTDENPLQN